MACNLTQGFTLDCLEGIGGVKEIFFANWDTFETGVAQDGTTEEIEDLPTATIYRYQPFRNSGSFVETANPSLENGTLFYTQAVALRVGQLSATKRKELNLLSKAKVIVFIRTFDDEILMIGRTDGAFLTAGTGGTGAAKGDFNGYELTVTAEEPVRAFHLEAYTTDPFDNFAGITVSPAYGNS